MKTTIDEELDVAYVRLPRGKVQKRIELRPGLLFDLNRKGEVVGIVSSVQVCL